MYCYCTYDRLRRDHERTVERAELLIRLRGYPAPKHSPFFRERRLSADAATLCDSARNTAREATVCFSKSA